MTDKTDKLETVYEVHAMNDPSKGWLLCGESTELDEAKKKADDWSEHCQAVRIIKTEQMRVK